MLKKNGFNEEHPLGSSLASMATKMKSSRLG